MSEFSGKVVHVGNTEIIGEKGFKKRVLVVSDEHPDYEQQVPFEFTQDNVDKLNSVKVGDSVNVAYNLRGNKWKEKWYANVNGWKIDVTQSAASPAPAPPPAAPKATSPQEAAFEDDSDDLPF